MLSLSIEKASAQAVLIPNAEQCFQGTAGLNGMVATLGSITGGSGGTAGVYPNVSLTGSATGTLATANITVSGAGVVTSVVILNPGINYIAGDTLSAASGNIGGVAGFSVPVASIAINSAVAGGSVGFYIPSTLTFSQTWGNASQTILNQNPVPLDINGCMVAYGIGTYRQIVYDSLGNILWDKNTSIPPINPFWAGTAGGTANALTVTDTAFSGLNGQIIELVASLTNTGAATLNPSGFGNIPIVKNSAAGLVALTGGEIVLGNQYQFIYSASLNEFVLQNPSVSAAATPAMLPGAYGTSITNNVSTPSTQLSASATMAVLVNSSGFGVQVSSPSVTINAATIGANGIDAGGLAINSWYYVFLINNGSTTAGLISLSSTAPTLPTGYTYSLRIGAAKTDGSANFYRFVQKGNYFQWQVVAASNTAALPTIVSGATGSTSVPTWTSETVQASSGANPLALVPPTAKGIKVLAVWQALGSNAIIVAPNNAYGPSASTSNPPPVQNESGGTSGVVADTLMLESTAIFVASQANAALFADGFVDSTNVN